MSEQFPLPKSWQYFFLGFLLWVLVDFGTAGGFRISYFEKYGPALLLFYIGYPLTFSVLIFKLHWSERHLFVATLAAIFVVEVLFTRNPLVMTFPALLLGIPLAIMVYAPLTYFPLWFVRQEAAKHRLLIIGLVVVELVVEDESPYSSVVVFEFKRPMRDDYKADENPIEQTFRYVEQIKSDKIVDKDGRPISLPSMTPFYCYVVCDLTQRLREQARHHGLRLTPDGEGFFGYNENVGTYIEIISFDKLVRDAKKRNRILFETLNLPANL